MSRENCYYHGSSIPIKHPDIERSREDIDFGKGFYLTMDADMAAKWACNKSRSFVSEYTLNLQGLTVKEMSASKEWLDYIAANRSLERDKFPFDDSKYDVIIGPIADDKLFNILDMYMDGLLSDKNAIKAINCMQYVNQVVLKTNKAVLALQYVDSREISGDTKENYRKAQREAGRQGRNMAEVIIRQTVNEWDNDEQEV